MCVESAAVLIGQRPKDQPQERDLLAFLLGGGGGKVVGASTEGGFPRATSHPFPTVWTSPWPRGASVVGWARPVGGGALGGRADEVRELILLLSTTTNSRGQWSRPHLVRVGQLQAEGQEGKARENGQP